MGVTVPLIAAAVGGAAVATAMKPRVPGAPPPPTTTKPEEVEPQAVDAESKQRRRTRASANRSGTVLTGDQSMSETGNTYAGSTLLGG